MCRYRVNQLLIVLNLYSVSVNKFLVIEFITVIVSQNLNFMLNKSTQQQFIRYAFSKVIECLNKSFENKTISKDHQTQSK